jgi:hypothetical protein
MLSILAKLFDVALFLVCHRLPIHIDTLRIPISDRKSSQNPKDTHSARQTTIDDYVLSRHAPRQSERPYLIRNILR